MHLPASPAARYLATLSPGSRRAQAQALRKIAEILWPNLRTPIEALPWAGVGYDQALAIRARLLASHAPATVNRILSALRGVLRATRQEEARAIASEIPRVSAEREVAGRLIPEPELHALLDACTSLRDRAVLLTLVTAGLRRAEAAALTDADVALPKLRVHGKGDKVRTVFLAGEALAAVRAYQAEPRMPGPFFQVQNGDAVWKLVNRVARRAGIDVSPHDFRRTFISRALDAGCDLVAIQRAAGHANPKTTARYDRRGDDAVQAVIAKAAL